ncbi:MAG TPA: NAD-dependent protein deacetylase [Polyangiales bacterium]|nr:NAD-dependent protein deacetylase [Polyangiales bacterium]
MDRLESSVHDLTALLCGRRVAVLTGAGISTESGIPDYRGPETLRRARKPMRFQEYASSAEGRARYWARSMLGWPRFASARPNAGHHALVELERAGAICGIITQNVDRLHQAAGSRRVIELHGALAEVRCLNCDASEARTQLQERLSAQNPWLTAADAPQAPDGDADLAAHWLQGFRVANCLACDGILKPNVVFFGESVPRQIVESGLALIDEAEALLVLGSSLAVYSGYRFVKRAHERGLPIAIITLGQTRADALAHVRADQKIGDLLPLVARNWLTRCASDSQSTNS